MKDFSDVQNVHFIGIGGIGISAVARMFLDEGLVVSGSDVHTSRVLKQLLEKGAKITLGEHSAEALPKETDLVIYTVAISSSNPELVEAKRRGVPTLSYPEALGVLSNGYKTIAVAGTHGKTTTTAMMGAVLKDAGLDPTVVVGSLLSDGGSNYVSGDGDYLIVEADEYRRAFLNLSPYILIITNIEVDHLDYYRDLEDIKDAFGELACRLPKNGYLICDKKSPTLDAVIKNTKAHVVDYVDYFDDALHLKMPGEHYRADAAAAEAVATSIGISKSVIRKALEAYSGVWRRFEYKGVVKSGALVYDDYAHHPTEIMATLKAAKNYFTGKRIVVLFQPHQYSRTKALFDDFARAFGSADEIFVLPIEKIREEKDPAVSSEKLVNAMRKADTKAQVVSSSDEATEVLEKNLKENDVLFTMGATEVYKVGEELVRQN